METQNQAAQTFAHPQALDGIAAAIEKCWDALQPHLSECANCGAGEHEAAYLSEVATLLSVAVDRIGYVAWTLAPEDQQCEAEDSKGDGEPDQGKSLDQIADDIELCLSELDAYRMKYDRCLEEADDCNGFYLAQAMTLLEIASDRVDCVAWKDTPEGQQAHASHSQG